MPIKKKKVESSLERKGFVKKNGNHSFFFYVTKSGIKTNIRTKTSYGTNHRDIGDNLLSCMARNCELNNKQFNDLIECPLSRDDYEQLLVNQDILDAS